MAREALPMLDDLCHAVDTTRHLAVTVTAINGTHRPVPCRPHCCAHWSAGLACPCGRPSGRMRPRGSGMVRHLVHYSDMS